MSRGRGDRTIRLWRPLQLGESAYVWERTVIDNERETNNARVVCVNTDYIVLSPLPRLIFIIRIHTIHVIKV